MAVKKRQKVAPKKRAPAPKKSKKNFPKKVATKKTLPKKVPAKAKKVPAKAKKAVKKTAKKVVIKRKPLYIIVNNQRIGVRSGLKRTMRGADIVEFTGVKVSKAILRRNGKKISLLEKYSIRRGDVFEVKQYRTKRKVTRQSNQAPEPRNIPMTGGEIFVANYPRWRAQEKAILAARKGPKRPDLFEQPEGEWVNGMPEEFRRADGSTASWESHVRAHPNADNWFEQMRRLERRYGEDAEELRDYMQSIADETGRPIQEVYTLLMSH